MTRIEIVEKMEVIMKENFQEVKYKEFDNIFMEYVLSRWQKPG